MWNETGSTLAFWICTKVSEGEEALQMFSMYFPVLQMLQQWDDEAATAHFQKKRCCQPKGMDLLRLHRQRTQPTTPLTQSSYSCGFDSRNSRYRWSVLWLSFDETLIMFWASAQGYLCQCLWRYAIKHWLIAATDVDSIVDSRAIDEASCCLRRVAYVSR